MTRTVYRPHHAWCLLSMLLAGPARAAEGVQFFDDNDLTFEASPETAPSPSPHLAQEPVPQADTPPRPVQRSAPVPPREERVEGLQEVLPAKAEPPPPPAVPKPVSLSGASAVLPSGLGIVQVLEVRAVTEDERTQMKEYLRCTDPAAVKLKVTGRMRAIVAKAVGVAEDRLSDAVTWIVGKKERCFARPPGTVATEIDVLDDTIRRVVAISGGR